MFKIILLVLPLILLPGCARKTGSIQTGGNQPAFQLNGDNLRLNPQLLGITDMPAINLDTYSNGTVDVSIGAYQDQQRPDRGKAW